MTTSKDYQERLSEPFGPEDLKWKPQAVRENRCLAIAYVTARAIMDRLDEVLTPAGWQDEYVNLPEGTVMCKLSLKLEGEWVVKCDVGGESEQSDQGDRMKAAFSDALKRTAVKFGIGRYLYRLPHQWVDYDPQKKQIKAPPKLPDWALPRPKPAAAPAAERATKISAADRPLKVSPDQLHLLMEFAEHFCWEPEAIQGRLHVSYGVSRFEDLTRDQATHLLNGLVKKYGSPEQWADSSEGAEERAAIQQEGART